MSAVSRRNRTIGCFFCNVFFFFFLGAIFEQGSDEVQTAFKLAVFLHNQNNTERRFELQAYVDVIKTADAYKLSKLSKWFLKIHFFFSFKLLKNEKKIPREYPNTTAYH